MPLRTIVAAAGIIASLSVLGTALVISSDCQTWCGPERALLILPTLALAFAWLLIVLVLQLATTDRPERTAALSAAVAAISWAVFPGFALLPVPADVASWEVVRAVGVLAVGLQVPPAWRLASLNPAAPLAQAAAVVLTVAALVGSAALAPFLAPRLADDLVLASSAISSAALVALVMATIPRAQAERPGMGALLAASVLLLLSDFAGWGLGLAATALLAVGWALIAVSWMRARRLTPG